MVTPGSIFTWTPNFLIMLHYLKSTILLQNKSLNGTCCLNSLENINWIVTSFARCAERTLTVWTASSLDVRHLGSSESRAIVSSGIMFPQEKRVLRWFWPTPSGCLLCAKSEETEVPSKLWPCLCKRSALT